MIKVLTPFDSNFNYKECESFYLENKLRINDKASFASIIKNTLFYSFYNDSLLTLCVYFFVVGDKLWVNGFGKRHQHNFNKQCFIKLLQEFNADIYAKTLYKEVVWALLKCGFKKCSNNVYVYKQIVF